MATETTYPIHPDELPQVRAYADRKRGQFGAEAVLQLRAVRTIPELEVWRQRHLSITDWTRLRSAIRQTRYQKNRHGQRARLVVSASTRNRIHTAAKRAGLTVDQTINQLLGEQTHVQS